MRKKFYLRILNLTMLVLVSLGFGVAYAAPPNDDCSNATPISMATGACTPTNYTNVGWTSSGTSGCGPSGNGDIWFSTTSTQSEFTVKIGSLPTNTIRLSVFDACGGSQMFCVIANANTSHLIVTAPGTYLIRIAQSIGDPQGDIGLCVWEAGGCNATLDASSNSPVCSGATINLTSTPSGGQSPYTYNWSGPAGFSSTLQNPTRANATTAMSGTYSVTVTDANNCTATASTNVTVEPSVTPTITGPTSVCTGGSVTLDAGGGYSSYTWSNGGGNGQTATFNNINSNTTFSVTVTNGTGCSGSDTHLVTVSQVTATASSTDETCNNCNNGTASVSASGANSYTYLWSNGATTQTITGLPPGTYSVTVTGNNGCTGTSSDVVNQYGCPGITASITKTDALCFGEHGTATATVTGGTAPYTYVWSSGDTTATITRPAGVYTVVVNDANGCGSATSVVINQPPQLTVTTDVTAETCALMCNGKAKAIVVGGTTPYVYEWSNGDTTEQMSNLCPVMYSLTVSDAHGCTATAHALIDSGLIVKPEISGDTMVCFGKSGELHVPAQFDSYRWTSMGDTTTLDTTNIMTWSSKGTYVIYVSKSGCVAYDTATVDVNPELLLEITREGDVLKALISGGSGEFTYKWSTGEVTETIQVVTPGTYSVTVTDDLGCDVSSTFDFTVSTVEVSTKPVKVYPNPVSEQLTIEIPEGVTMESISIFSLTGQLMQVSAETTKLDVSQLFVGTYILTVTTNSGILRTKFVKI